MTAIERNILIKLYSTNNYPDHRRYHHAIQEILINILASGNDRKTINKTQWPGSKTATRMNKIEFKIGLTYSSWELFPQAATTPEH